ncbi:hypothetical protein FB567DRAFT_525194 [Paraphoma chrysanthemicola]|uniref:Uncharacterized protein n=1 Tax=Paraphoma chrysanthemicola TaxID=798071 RepID=A0A8K0VZ34_9PLEO|nr:hypothetical protein FB567DRAFT_525194 [Paraphoma chrysanthemicola]
MLDMDVQQDQSTHAVSNDYTGAREVAKNKFLDVYSKWRADCLTTYRKYGIMLHINPTMWTAITEYAKVDNAYLCDRLTSLPYELSDPIYDMIVENIEQDLVIECIKGIEERGMNGKNRLVSRIGEHCLMPCIERLNEWMRLSFLDKRMWNEEFFYEIMSRYYARTSIWLSTQPYYDQGHTKFDFNLWRLLGSDALGSVCVPAKFIPKVTIQFVLGSSWGTTARKLLLPPANAVPIEGAYTRVVIRAVYRYLQAKSCCRVPYIHREPKDGRNVVAKLRPVLDRMRTLGLNVKLLYGRDAKLLYAARNFKEKSIPDKNMQPRHIRRPGLRNLRQNVTYSA